MWDDEDDYYSTEPVHYERAAALFHCTHLACFAELKDIQRATRSGKRPGCPDCGMLLPEKGRGLRGSNNVITLWFMRCARCRRGIIIFNST